MYKICVLFFSILFSTNLYSTEILEVEKISIEDIFALEKDNPSMEGAKEIVKFLENSKPNTPYLRGVNLATQIEKFNPVDNELYLRFNTRSIRETTIEKDYHSSILQNKKMDINLHKISQSLEKMQITVNLISSYNEYQHRTTLVEVFEDKVNVLQKMSQELVEFDYKDLISAMDDLFEAQTRKSNAKDAFLQYNRQLYQFTNHSNQLYMVENKSIIKIDEIENIINNISEIDIQDNIFIETLELEKTTAQLNYDLEKASNRRVLNYFEARYDIGSTIDERESQYSFKMSFNLPFVSSSRFDEHRRLIDVLEIESEIREASIAVSQSVAAAIEKLNLLITQYKKYLERQKYLTGNDALNTYVNIEGIDPLAVLSLKEMTISNEIQIQRITYGIYSEYINLLYFSGIFHKNPEKNFLLTGVTL